jgi:UDP-N-acetylmuramoyl-L-alanyl-D-glutamate--2,6-diaminopimelate ligase
MLKDILYKVNIRAVNGDTAVAVKDLQTDSRKVTPGSCFIAIKGTVTDGHDFIAKAVENGATSVVAESIPSNTAEGVTYVEVENSALAAGMMSHQYYGEPSTKLKMIGVTGTNGKTTIATLSWKLFTSLGYKCGLVSTVQNQVGDRVVESTHTTPDAISLNKLLKEMVDEGCTHVFHGMQQSCHSSASHCRDTFCSGHVQ